MKAAIICFDDIPEVANEFAQNPLTAALDEVGIESQEWKPWKYVDYRSPGRICTADEIAEDAYDKWKVSEYDRTVLVLDLSPYLGGLTPKSAFFLDIITALSIRFGHNNAVEFLGDHSFLVAVHTKFSDAFPVLGQTIVIKKEEQPTSPSGLKKYAEVTMKKIIASDSKIVLAKNSQDTVWLAKVIAEWLKDFKQQQKS